MTYFPKQLALVHKNLRQHGLDPHRVDFRISDSKTAFLSAAQKGESFDFILVDGCHKLPYVTQDLRWMRLLNPGGTACFHDYSTKHPGVRIALDAFLKRYKNYEVRGLARSLLVVEKTGPSEEEEIRNSDLVLSRARGLLIQLKQSIRKRLKR